MPGVGDLRGFSTSRSVGSSLRPPRPLSCHQPGPSRTSSGRRIGVQAPFIGLRIVTTLLRSVRTTAGSLAAHRPEPKLRPGDQDPASPGVRDRHRPSTDTSSARPLPGTRVAPDSLRADGTTRPASFRPRGFSPPRRLSPREGPRACCIPLPVLGFVAFLETLSLGTP
jgi:hypothetical protein